MVGGFCGSDDTDLKDMMGPGWADHSLRQAIQSCWMTLPKEKRTLDDLEKEVRRLIDRAFKDMREDEAMREK